MWYPAFTGLLPEVVADEHLKTGNAFVSIASNGGLIVGAATGGLLGTLRPQWLRPVFVGWMILAFPVGWLVSHLLLGALYFAVFTPLGLLLRLLGKDALGLRRSTAASYWQKKPQQTDLRRYLRQY
jgi:hypothetical protein